jgi:hypothetical protein
MNRIGSVMVSVLASSAIDCGYEPRSGQTKEYKIGICCFSAKNAALRRKSKDWLARNQNNVSECIYRVISKSPKKLSNCLKRAETSVVLIVFDCVPCEVRAYKFISLYV